MADLSASGSVKKFLTKADLDHSLKGAAPVLCRLALITTEKNGQLKHRLILDCRASGSNSKAVRRERILLSLAWDAIRDTLEFLATAREGDDPRYFALTRGRVQVLCR